MRPGMFALAVLLTSLFPPMARAQFGEFVGTLVLMDVPPFTREFRTANDFAFVDTSGKTWRVPAGATVDGASIPQFFWSFIGGPWEGPYRRASVVHDYYCEVQTEPWASVHLMFYNAMRAGGVGENKAKLMYYAVERFGPRWESRTRSVPVCAERRDNQCVSWLSEEKVEKVIIRPIMDEAQARAFAERVEQQPISVDEIKAVADAQLKEALLRAGDPSR